MISDTKARVYKVKTIKTVLNKSIHADLCVWEHGQVDNLEVEHLLLGEYCK